MYEMYVLSKVTIGLSVLVPMFVAVDGFCTTDFELVPVSTIDECVLDCYHDSENCVGFAFTPSTCLKYSASCSDLVYSVAIKYYTKLIGKLQFHIAYSISEASFSL